MKNFKINQRIKALIGAGILTLNLTGCSLTGKVKEETKVERETYTQLDNYDKDSEIKQIVVDQKLVSIEDIRLYDTKTDKIIETVDGVIVDNKVMNVKNAIDVKLGENIDSVLINDQLVDPSTLGLINIKTNEKLDSIDFVLVGNELVEAKLKETNNIKDDKEEFEYVELTDELFYELADNIYNKYKEIGLDVTKEEVIDFTMIVNIEQISRDNKELVNKIIGKRNSDNVILNTADVYSAIKTKNDNNYCAKNLGWDSLILVSDTIFDKTTSKKVEEFEKRTKEIFDARENKEEFNTLLNKLLMEVLTANEEEFNMDYGAGYSSMEVLIYFIRSNFEKIMDENNKEQIRFFCNYANDYGKKNPEGISYYENSRSTAYWNGIYFLLTENVNCKVKTK